MDSVSEARLQLVHPRLSELIHQLADRLQAEGIEFRVTQGIRSWADQQKLYEQVPKVTNAPPGHSWHNFGLAVDVAPDDPKLPGYQPDWDESHPAWQRLVDVGTSLGLRNGKSWKDEPHFELTGQWGPSPPDEVRQLFEHGGVQAVWDELKA